MPKEKLAGKMGKKCRQILQDPEKQPTKSKKSFGLKEKKSSMKSMNQRSLIFDVRNIPENDADFANWLSTQLGPDSWAKTWQKWLNLYGRDFLIKGIKRLIKYQKRHEDDVKNGVKGAKLIDKPSSYLNSILRSFVKKREQDKISYINIRKEEKR